jgi:hypothetical protein
MCVENIKEHRVENTVKGKSGKKGNKIKTTRIE